MTLAEIDNDNAKGREIAHAVRSLKTQESVMEVLRQALTSWYDVFVIRYLGDMIIEEATKQKMNEDDLERFIWESIDGSSEVIYTFQAKLVAAASNNSGASLEYGVTYKDSNFDNARAFAAVYADVTEYLRFRKFDINDPPYQTFEA